VHEVQQTSFLLLAQNATYNQIIEKNRLLGRSLIYSYFQLGFSRGAIPTA
jgi:hypothetical protein